jgi:hypothetical protein
MRFAHPVLQERARIAEQAREARVRLSEGTPNVSLQKFMTERLRLLGADIDAVRWDAHRSDEGTWVVTGAWRAGHKSGTTLWGYDIPARVVSPMDAATIDFAEGTRLVRVVPDVPGGAQPAPAAVPASRRPVAVVREPEQPAEPAVEETPAPPDDEVRDVVPDAGTLPAAEPDFPDDIAEHDTIVLGRTGEDGEDADPRARVPAWEDIVFGVRRQH